MDYKNLLIKRQREIVLVIGFVLVALLSFGLGRLSAVEQNPPEIVVEEMFVPSANYTPTVSGIQSEETACSGGIKGSSSLIYHMPGGSFYDRTTNPIRCFQTEEEALSAGFKKSSR
jgi:hypothetical protein